MLNIVVYGCSGPVIAKNINFALLNYNIDYCIYRFVDYDDKLESIIKSDNKKIYILNIDSIGVNSLDVALKIREYDYDSIIIFVCSNDKFMKNMFNTKLMILDCIYMDNKFEERLFDDIRLAISIINSHKLFTFKYNSVIYRVPINEITYIEKEPEIKRCIIHTINNKYYIIGTLNFILSQLDDNFCRTHQSCIVNLSNIKRIELGNNIIIFKNNDRTDMLTSKMKKEIKDFMGIA